MVIKLPTADFSANNIGQIDIAALSDFTLAAIAASGNSTMTAEQKSGLEKFFRSVGAKSNTGPWAKIDSIYIPMISGDLAHAGVNYKGNVTDFVPSDTYYEIRNKGLAGKTTNAGNNTATRKGGKPNGKNNSVLFMMGEDLTSDFAGSCPFAYEGDSGADRFTTRLSKSSVGHLNLVRKYLAPSISDMAIQLKAAPLTGIMKQLVGTTNKDGAPTTIQFLKLDGTIGEVTQADIANVQTDTNDTWVNLFCHDTSAKAMYSSDGSYMMLIYGATMTEAEMATLRTASNALALLF